MPRFVIEETIPCHVTFRKVVEADSQEKAVSAYMDDGPVEELETRIGDQIAGMGDGQVRVAEPNDVRCAVCDNDVPETTAIAQRYCSWWCHKLENAYGDD